MSSLKRKWSELSFEKKLSIVVVPLLLAVVVGVLIPLINRTIEPDEPTPVLRAILRHLEVETGVTLATFSARHKTASAPSSGHFAAAV